MKKYFLILILPFFLFSSVIATECKTLINQLTLEEKAYDVVVELKVASKVAKNIIDTFIENGSATHIQCKTSMNIDRWVMMGKKIKKAKKLQSKYSIEDLDELKSYAIKNPPRQINYNRGRIIPDGRLR